MKIGFVSTYFYPAMIGGIEWYLYHVTRRLTGKGHDVHIYTTNSGGKNGHLPREDSLDGVKIHRFPTIVDASYRLKVWPSVLSQLRKDSPDVVHAFDYAQFHDFAVALSRKTSEWLAVASLYDIQSEIPRNTIKSFPMKVFDNLIAKVVLRNFDGVLIRTPYHSDFTIGLGIPKERTHVAPPGIDEAYFEEHNTGEIQLIRSKYALEEEDLLLYVGRINPIKGIETLIRSLPLLKKNGLNPRLVVVGPDHIGYIEHLKEVAKRLGVEAKTKFTGFISEEEKILLLDAADVTVLPSSFEGFGQSLIQAMAQGTPVIGTFRGAIPWVLEQGKSGLLFSYGSESGLAESVERIIMDDELRNRLVARGKKRASQFSYGVLVDELEEIYSDLMNK